MQKHSEEHTIPKPETTEAAKDTTCTDLGQNFRLRQRLGQVVGHVHNLPQLLDPRFHICPTALLTSG